MSLKHPPLLFTAGLLMAGTAVAGGVAEIESGDGGERVRSQLEFDRDRLRMEARFGDGAGEGYLIFRDGKPYAVSQVEGQTLVMEMGSMLAMGGPMAQGAGTDFSEVVEYLGLSATGRAETVGGLRGEVFRLDYRTANGARESRELVLGTQRAVRELTLALMQMSQALQQVAGTSEPEGSLKLQAELDRRQAGLLRYGDEFRLLSLADRTPPASRFELPAAPVQMPAGLPFPAAAGGAESPFGGVLGEKMERQKERVEGRTEAEADAATDRAVDKVLDKAFGKLFGGQ